MVDPDWFASAADHQKAMLASPSSSVDMQMLSFLTKMISTYKMLKSGCETACADRCAALNAHNQAKAGLLSVVPVGEDSTTASTEMRRSEPRTQAATRLHSHATNALEVSRNSIDHH